MILPDWQIRQLSSRIRPFNPEQVEPASYDVTLGNEFMVFQRNATPMIDMRAPHDITKLVKIPEDEYFLLHPGEFVLGVTAETIHMPEYLVGRLEGKSSIGRLGLMVHVTAGYIDPGFNGPITLEMTGLHPMPLALWPGMRIAQLSFHQMTARPRRPYNGRYQGATGVEASKYSQP